MKRIAAAAVVLSLAFIGADAQALTRRQWVNGVVAHTTLTRAQARWVWVHRPRLRDEFPVKHGWTSRATKVASPAIATAGTQWCKITTTEKYRAPLFPFGDQVLFSFKLERTYSYDGHTVHPGSLFFDDDTTDWGWRWNFDGTIGPAEGYTDFSHFTHRTDLWGTFSTDSVVKITSVHSTLHTRIMFSADGDWSTMNTEGKPGCQNP